MSLFLSAEGRRGGRLLEFDDLLDLVARFASLERSAAALRVLEPSADLEQLNFGWSWLAELDRLLANGDDLPLGSMLDLKSCIGDERSLTGPLPPEELAGIGAACSALAQLNTAIARRAASLPHSATSFEGAFDSGPLGEHLAAALEPDGRIRDSASPRLRGLRGAFYAAETRHRDAARGAMSDASQKGLVNGSELVLRGDRYCLPLHAGKRSRVSGIVHDRSGTGQTVFVEPLAVVEAGNDVQEARLAVAEEEARIIAALHRQVVEHAEALVDLFDRAVALDSIRARARYGRHCHGEIPILSAAEDAAFEIFGFRHPLLEQALAEAGRLEDLVPLDLALRPGDRVLLVSGPNAGGKTVALKAAGLAVLMAQSVIPLPAGTPPKLPVVDAVLVDVGDEQSIADALSSFSSHMTHVREILQSATPRSLVLLDEMGGGTDPREGSALARAVLEHLLQLGCLCLCSTHYTELKALAHEYEGIRNASMAYDDEKFLPRFRLLLDRPGASHALEIAERLQLPAALLKRARELVGDESLRLDAVLRDLETERDQLETARRDAEQIREETRSHRDDYEGRAKELRQERRRLLDDAERQAEGVLRNARAKVERLLADIVAAGDADRARELAASARRELDERAKNLHDAHERRRTEKRGRAPVAIKLGAKLRHVVLGGVGEVVEIRGDRVTLDMRGRRVVASTEHLVSPDSKEAAEEAQKRPVAGSVRHEEPPAGGLLRSVDVRGEDVEDAWVAVDRAIDGCVMASVRELEIIHGKGTGKLRKELGRRLRVDSRVATVQLGGGGRYDDGLTVVELR